MSATKRKIPLRKCLGCGEMKPKKELIRVVCTAEKAVVLDPTGRSNGRGAYVCRSAECFAKARKAKRFERAFECRIPEEVFETIETELKTLE